MGWRQSRFTEMVFAWRAYGLARRGRSLGNRRPLCIEFLEGRCVPTTITPTTFLDGGLGSGSLRDAVLQFNADSGTNDDIIQLEAGTYTLTIQNVGEHHETAGLTGDLNLTRTSHRWIIQGAGVSGDNPTVIDASQLQDRVFQIVTPGTQVVFRDLIIQGGLAQDDGSDGALPGTTDALGGGILSNGGDLTLDNVAVENNVARGGDAAGLTTAGHNARGGGFYSIGGTLTISRGTIANNQAIGGRGADYGGAGGSAVGGGLYLSGGALHIASSTIASNLATGGQGGAAYTTPEHTSGIGGGTGGTAQGGGLYAGGGSLTISTSNIIANQGTGGAGGLGYYFGGLAGYGEGGGLDNGGTLTASDITASGNSSNHGSGYYFGGGGGGGIANFGTLTVAGSALTGNSTNAANSRDNGGGGGGIANFGTLTVSSTTVSSNSNSRDGGGVYNGGMLTINGGTVVENTALVGGGITNSGTLTISYSTVAGNTASAAGGIDNSGTLTVSNSTLAGNSASGSGPYHDGGGIYNEGTLTVAGSTVSDNIATGDGGGIYEDGTHPVTLINVTLSANRAGNAGGSYHGGGLFVASGSPVLHNTLIAGNSRGAAGTTRDDVFGTLYPGSDYNLIGDGTGMTGLSAINGNLVGSATAPIDPLLGPLQDNGGPTQTMALLPGSPAVDAGNNIYGAPTDQRGPGFPRVLYAAIDIGAFEQERGPLLTVTSTFDVHIAGLVTLREALDQANVDAGQGRSDTVTFAANLGTATITLTSGPLELSGTGATETIDGDGRITVSARDVSRVLQVDAGVRADFYGLAITHGRVSDDGAGIANAGTLTLSGCTLSANSASNSGGGVSNSGALEVTGSTLSGNTAGANGGAIYNSGTLMVSNSTLASNFAGRDGGGLWSGPAAGPSTLTNVTLSANRANTSGLGGEGGGLFVDSAAAALPLLHNTLIAGNFNGVTGTSRDDVNGALDPGGDYNLIGDGTGLSGLSNGSNGNLVGSAAAPIDPLLGALQDNDGPTQTMALLPGSAAANAGDNAYATRTDQRGPGFPRVLDVQIDIGAFELAPAMLTVTSMLDVHRDGLMNLREALEEANRDASRGQSDAIIFADNLGHATITLSAGQLELFGASATATMSIEGAGRVTISANNAGRVFQIDPGVRATLDALTITHGRVSDDGAGISNGGTLTLSGCTLSANIASNNGGGIYNYGTLIVSNSTLSGNSASYGAYLSDGGGIYNSGRAALSGCTLSANTLFLGGMGAGIFNSGTLTISNNILSGNSTPHGHGFGGGISNSGMLTVYNSILSGNTATVGGAIFTSGTLMVSCCTLASNIADNFGAINGGGGGGIFNSGSLTVTDTTVSGNSGTISGGGISNRGTLTISNSTLSGNSAIYNSGNGFGGGIYNTGTLTVSSSTLAGNSAGGSASGQYGGYGGGIYNYGSTLTVTNSTMSGNFATGTVGSGGGIYNAGTSPVTLTNVTLTANRANTGGGSGQGGGMFVLSGSPILHNTLIAGNFNGATGTTRDDVFGALNPAGNYNLIGDRTGMSGLQNGVNGNLVGTAAAPIDPLLDVLDDYGGPTLTQALLPGSPALNAGDPGQLGVADQRGVIRTGGVNIGAYQASATAFLVAAPDTVQSGVHFDVTVTAVDPFGQVAVGYTGTVTFSTTDPDPAVVLPANYAFTLDDSGEHRFTDTGLDEITLVTPGDQALTVTATADATISGSATITVEPGGPAPAPGGSPRPYGPGTSVATTPGHTIKSSSANAVERFFAGLAEKEAPSLWLPGEHRQPGDPAGWLTGMNRDDVAGRLDPSGDNNLIGETPVNDFLVAEWWLQPICDIASLG
jgi:hypothetical protein